VNVCPSILGRKEGIGGCSLRHIVGVVDVEKCYMPEIAGYPHGNYVTCFIEATD